MISNRKEQHLKTCCQRVYQADLNQAWWILVAVFGAAVGAFAADPAVAIRIPKLEVAPTIDGNLDEWREFAHHDGVWDVYRVQNSPWFEAQRNRLTDHGDEPGPWMDLSARYFIAWDDTWLYLGAEVIDNVNDVSEVRHEPKRWYYKDAIAWFIEAPADEVSERFGQGNHGFCFVIDGSYPDYGAWWRHGTPSQTYVEVPLPVTARDYHIRFDPKPEGAASYTLEARVSMQDVFGASDPDWTEARVGQELRMMIVHTDPDGGDYGGHLLIYGAGDDDATWSRAVFVGPIEPVQRLPR
jgi:hypothetical protein